MKPMKSRILTVLIFMVLIIVGCQNKQNISLETLKQKGIEFNGETFIKSVKDNNVETVNLFLKAGINPNERDDFDLTPLMYASEKGNNEIIQMLIESGADVNAINTKSYLNALSLAILSGKAETVKILINSGADVNYKEEKDNLTPLMVVSGAVSNIKNSSEIVGLLLKSKASVNQKDKRLGWTALHFASNQNNLAVTKALLDGGADINSKGNEGQTPLIRAALVGNIEIVQELVNRGADVNITDITGKTALRWARDKGHYQVVKILEGQ